MYILILNEGVDTSTIYKQKNILLTTILFKVSLLGVKSELHDCISFPTDQRLQLTDLCCGCIAPQFEDLLLKSVDFSINNFNEFQTIFGVLFYRR